MWQTGFTSGNLYFPQSFEAESIEATEMDGRRKCEGRPCANKNLISMLTVKRYSAGFVLTPAAAMCYLCSHHCNMYCAIFYATEKELLCIK